MKGATKVNFSKYRRTASAYVEVANTIPFTHITAEIRVPGLRAFCMKHGVTYTIAIMKVIAAVKDKYPIVSGVFGRDFTLRKKIYLCDSVDMSLAIEKQDKGEDFATFAVIKDVDKKNLHEISTEVKALKDLPMIKMPNGLIFALLYLMPDSIKSLIFRSLLQIPPLFKYFFGTVGLSTLGKYGITGFDTLFVNNFGYAISKIEDKQIIENGKIHIEPVLYLTQTSNHRVADGALSARVLAEIQRIFESGEYMVICEPEVVPIKKYSQGAA